MRRNRPMSERPDIEVSIVMPCLNEEESIRECIRMAREGLEQAGAEGEIVIADNGSTDGSQEIAREMGARVVDVPGKGYGAALMGGFEAARGRYIVMGDADGSYDFSSISPFIERLRAGDDLVMGNRFRGGIKEGAMPFLNRYLGNPVLSFVGRLLFPQLDRRLPLRAARLPPRRPSAPSTCRARAWSSPARWSSRRPSRG